MSGKDIAITSQRLTEVYYSNLYTAAAYGFDTTRKAAWIVESLNETPIAGVHLFEPSLLSDPQLEAIHAIEYVDAVKTGSPRHLYSGGLMTREALVNLHRMTIEAANA